MTADFSQMLQRARVRSCSMLCVGLDPSPSRFPPGFNQTPDGAYNFCRRIVDATAGSVCAFKPQIAHFAALGAERELARLVDYVHRQHPGIPVILDAKRGDIGSTADRYAEEVFIRFGADAATVNPYPGWESVAAFLRHPGKGVIVLCRTSNPDAGWLQSSDSGEDAIFVRVATRVQKEGNPELGLVVGATAPKHLASVRRAAPDVTLLVPGIGAQGGSVEQVLDAGISASGAGLIVSASRSVLYASQGRDWEEAAAREAQRLALLLRPPPSSSAG